MNEQTSLSRETVIRAAFPAIEFRDAQDEKDQLGVLRVLFSPVNEWTEIKSRWEDFGNGHFMERFAPGAWTKTIQDRSSKIRALFQHGMDPQIGDKPLGPIRLLEENDRGGYAEVQLLDTSYNRDLLPGLRAGLYGSSHRFTAMRADEVQRPEPSPRNPDGIPERTITEASLYEFGPVTFPAYAGANAGVRSLTDDFLLRCFQRDPAKLRRMFEERMDSEDAGLLGQMLVLASEYIDEQDEMDPTEIAAAAAMQIVQADLIKLLNVEAAETEPPEPEGRNTAPSTTDAAMSTSVPERRAHQFTLNQKETPAWRLP